MWEISCAVLGNLKDWSETLEDSYNDFEKEVDADLVRILLTHRGKRVEILLFLHYISLSKTLTHSLTFIKQYYSKDVSSWEECKQGV